MAITKNALIRYQTIDKCLRNKGRTYDFNQLLEAVNEALSNESFDNSGIQTRQLRDDIRFMRSETGYSAPIETRIGNHGKKHFYYYSDPDFSINNSPLNETELFQLKTVLSLFDRFEGNPGFEWVAGMSALLKKGFNLSDNNQKYVSFESNIDYSGYVYFTDIFNAIMYQKVLRIKYEPFGKEPYELEFHPSFLKQYNNRWFTFGFNPYNGLETWNLALDRIIEIKECDAIYHPSKIDWEDHFSDLIGVTYFEGNELQEVELLFSDRIAPYILTKPLHQTQKVYFEEEGVRVKIKVRHNLELEQMILSFGEQIKVVSPIELKVRIQSRITDAQRNYQ